MPYKDELSDERAMSHLQIMKPDGSFWIPKEDEDDYPDGFRHGFKDDTNDVLFGDTRGG